jgi:glycosyltransferase involved in cell wall biosynthesis
MKKEKRNQKISVAMAVYNGEKYLREQIDSILCQLNDCDELVVSYDRSQDSSLDVINVYANNDSRVKVFENSYKPGVVKNFQNAVEHTTGDIIFYSDQDDVWLKDKIEKVVKEFEDSSVAVVFHDARLTDAELNITQPSTFKLRGGARETTIGNLFRLSYIGCCMAFRAEYKPVVLPIPTIYRSHDWWTGCLLGIGRTKMKAIHQPLIYHRQHSDNVTPTKRPPLSYQLKVRWIIIKNIILRYRRKCKIDKQLLG